MRAPKTRQELEPFLGSNILEGLSYDKLCETYQETLLEVATFYFANENRNAMLYFLPVSKNYVWAIENNDDCSCNIFTLLDKNNLVFLAPNWNRYIYEEAPTLNTYILNKSSSAIERVVILSQKDDPLRKRHISVIIRLHFADQNLNFDGKGYTIDDAFLNAYFTMQRTVL